jgi:cell division protein FtsW
MRNGFTVEKTGKHPVDYIFIALLLLLLGLGFAVLFSSSYFRAETLFGNPFHFLKKQVIWVVLGAAAILILSRISLEFVKKTIPVLLVISLALSVLTFVPGVGAQFLGAKRWIFLFGYSFQPSELVKVTLILYLAYMLSKKQVQLDDPVNTLLPPFIIVSIFVTIIYLQNDFSTSFFLLILSLIIFFIAGVKIFYFVFLGILVVPLSLILLLSREHRVNRIIAFLEPGLDPSGAGYQVIASKAALINGGLWGKGIGLSEKKFGGLPEVQSDFIFAILGEEMGFIGVLIILLLFIAFAYRGYMIALKSENQFAYFLAFGFTSSILYQVLINLSVVCGLLPATGLPLPFFSSGGSSILMTMIMCGFLINLSRKVGVGGEDLYG